MEPLDELFACEGIDRRSDSEEIRLISHPELQSRSSLGLSLQTRSHSHTALYLSFSSPRCHRTTSHRPNSPSFTTTSSPSLSCYLPYPCTPHRPSTNHTTMIRQKYEVGLTDVPSATGDQQPPTGSFIQLDLFLVSIPGEDAPT